MLMSLHDGKTLQEIFGKKHGKHIGGRIVRDDRFYAFCRANPAIGKRIHQLASKNRDAARAEARRQRVPTVTRNPSVGSLKAINSAIAHLPDEIRDDVQIAIWLAYSERRLKLRDIKTRLSEFVRAENKMFSKYVPHSGGIMQSLDQQVYDDGPTRLVDTVTHGLWD